MKLLTIVEQALKDKQYIVGSNVTIADIYLTLMLTYVFKLLVDKKFANKTFPNTLKYFENLMKLPQLHKYMGKAHFMEKEWEVLSAVPADAQ